MAIRERLSYLVRVPLYFVEWFGALGARDRRDWPDVVRRVERLHERGFETNDTRLCLGIALLEQERWRDALASFESIRGRFSSQEQEGYRWVNHALALFMLGRREESARIIREEMSEAWNDAQLKKANAILDDCGNAAGRG